MFILDDLLLGDALLEAFAAAAPEMFAAGSTAAETAAATAAATAAETEAASLAASQAAAAQQAGIAAVPDIAGTNAGILDPSATLRGPVPYGPEADFQSFVQDVDTGGAGADTGGAGGGGGGGDSLNESYRNSFDQPDTYTPPTPSTSPKSPLENGYDTAVKFAKEHPFQTAGLAYMGASATGLLNQKGINPSAPYSGPLSNYHLSPNFQGSHANPQDFQYTPRRYDSGGITQIPSYAKGSTVDSYFTDMIDRRQAQAAPSSSHDVGIYHDNDPDTMYLDPLTAAMVRQSKLDSRSHVNTAAKFHQPVPMGTLNFKPVAAAHGGIMGASNLGGYAAGGNPRLLKGPGDGMSDNIPATINNRQPARLADGEFVIPADVVSHLGNGSTDAGAKRLHNMMTEIRKARTGNPRQGKEINPKHFIPK